MTAGRLTGQARRVRRAVQSRLPFPYRNGFKAAFIYSHLLRSQWWDEERIRGYQLARLRRVTRFAYEQIPYYRRLFQSAGICSKGVRSFDEFLAIPLLTKDDVITNFADMLPRDIHRLRSTVSQTSGSTGTPMTFYVSRMAAIYEWVFVQRHYRWAGYGPDDRAVAVRGRILSEALDAPAPYLVDGSVLYLSSFHLSETSLPVYADLIAGFSPRVLRAYPSALMILTDFYRRTARPKPVFAVIITSSETLSDEVRKDAEVFWGCRVVDWYGMREWVGAIAECEEGSYHVMEDYGYVEFVPVADGGQHRIVSTGLHNLAMPLIRYDTRDVATRDSSSDEACACGRAFRRIAAIDGRIEGLVFTRDGRRVGRLDAALKGARGLRLAQLVQPEVGTLIVRMVTDDTFGEHSRDEITKGLRLRLGNEIDIQYETVDDIPKTQAGKVRFVVSDVVAT